jgi:hypothetical protein
MVNWKNLLTTAGSAFLGGAVTFATTHLTGGVPTTEATIGAFGLGALITGLTAVYHLYTTAPPSKLAKKLMMQRPENAPPRG